MQQNCILSGVIKPDGVNGETFNHFENGKACEFILMVKRLSGTVDEIPVVISEEDYQNIKSESPVALKLRGSLHSLNKMVDGKSKLLVYFSTTEILDYSNDYYDFENQINIFNGYVCKEPVYRVTPLGREICDLFIAVNRSNGRSDYIPCICWGRAATFAKNLRIGTNLSIRGRFQSRQYNKTNSNGEIEVRTTYEVSISSMKVIVSKE